MIPSWCKVASTTVTRDDFLRITRRGRVYFRATKVTTVLLECGHQKIIRGDAGVPKQG